MTSKAGMTNLIKTNSKKESNQINMGKEIILYNIETRKNEKFIVPPGGQLTLKYTLGTPFEYKINDEDKFSDYCEMIRLEDRNGKEHLVYVKDTVLSGDMCLPPIQFSSKSRNSRYNDGYSNGYSDPDDFDDDYDCVNGYSGSNYYNKDEDDEAEGYEFGNEYNEDD